MFYNNEESIKVFLIRTGKNFIRLYFWFLGFSAFLNYIRKDDKTVPEILFDALFLTVLLLIFEYRENKKKNKLN